MGQQQAVHTGGAEFCQHFQPVLLAVQQALLVDIVNVHKVHSQLPQALGGKVAVFYGVGRRKDAAPGRGVGQFDGSHTQSLFLFIVGPGSGYRTASRVLRKQSAAPGKGGTHPHNP